MNGRAYTYDCHGWIEGITTSIPGFVPSLPELPELQGSVSNDFYRSATTGSRAADAIEPMPLYEDYTEQIMYATGSHPRYDGTASAHVATAGGRYDYLFDCHDRLVKAEYLAADGISALGGDVDYTENFSTEYTYNAVGVPLTVKRYGVQRIDNSSGTATEQFGILDNLSYSYDGMLLSSVLAYGSAYGEDYYGRPGFPTSYEGGPAEYGWNAAGLLDKDSARGITGISYNWNGQPTKIDFTDKGYMSYSYSAAGTLTGVATYAVLGGKRATKVSERRYCGDFVFEGDSLLYANFGGGYFDGAGQPHYRHADFQGNITMVTDCRGQVEQHTGYYPYGEPWREPTGQPYLYGGKERMRDHALNEYDFGARCLSSALCLWTTPDPLATDYAPVTPYSYCAGNSIRFIDPSGCDLIITGKLAKKALEQLQQATPGITLSMENGNVSYKVVNEKKVNAGSKKIMESIDNKKITTKLKAEDTYTVGKKRFTGGAYGGNVYVEQKKDDQVSEHVTAYQLVNPLVLAKAEEGTGYEGSLIMHEVTEAYEGAKKALKDKKSSPMAGERGSTFNYAHSRALPQLIEIEEEFLDLKGNPTTEDNATFINAFVFKNGQKVYIQKIKNK